MPNFKKHLVAGVAVAGTANLIYQVVKLYTSADRPANFWNALEQVKWGEVAAFAAIGGTIASLPDILEPPCHPNHRGLFHSVGCGTAVAYGAFGRHTECWSEGQRHAVRVGAFSYLSHLFLDAGTPKCLPLIGLNLSL